MPPLKDTGWLVDADATARGGLELNAVCVGKLIVKDAPWPLPALSARSVPP
jgi:hypothetical protein